MGPLELHRYTYALLCFCKRSLVKDVGLNGTYDVFPKLVQLLGQHLHLSDRPAPPRHKGVKQVHDLGLICASAEFPDLRI